jgi:hypothetical protein
MKNVQLKYPAVLSTQQRQTVISVVKYGGKCEALKVRKWERKLNSVVFVYKITEF